MLIKYEFKFLPPISQSSVKFLGPTISNYPVLQGRRKSTVHTSKDAGMFLERTELMRVGDLQVKKKRKIQRSYHQKKAMDTKNLKGNSPFQ